MQFIKEHREPSLSEKFGNAFQSIAGGLAEGIPKFMMQQQAGKQEQELSNKLGLGDISKLDAETKRSLFVEALKGGMKDKEASAQQLKNTAIIRQLEKDRGLSPGSLEAYVSNPTFAEKLTRPNKEALSDRPTDPEQMRIINSVRNSPGFEDLDEAEQYKALTQAGVSRPNALAEADIRSKQLTRKGSEVQKAFDAQKDFIDETTKSAKGWVTDMKPRLEQLQSLNSDEEIIGAPAAAMLEHLGIPLGVLDNPSTELYNKVSQDLLKGLPETYGNRILKVEVENFLKTIPTLMNSADGRRMIASNMLKLGEMKELYYDEMRRQQLEFEDKNKPLPRDFQQRVFDQVKPNIERINSEFVKLSQITSVPQGTVPYFDPNGNVVFVPKNQMQWAEKNGGKRIW